MTKNCALKSGGLIFFLMFFGYACQPIPKEMKAPVNQSYATTVSVASPSSSEITSATPNLLGITVGPTSGVRGVKVIAVAPGSPCESVIKPGDAIFALTLIGQGDSRLGGAKVNTDNFQAEVSKIQQGMSVKLMLSTRYPVLEVICKIP
ncbi:MAG: hypothetical protein WCK63_05830 [Betaproteobacteria bacterium]